MKILLIQETDWFVKGPLQQHHIMERLSLEGHEIRVIDYEVVWNASKTKELVSKHQIIPNVSKVCENANITVIRPPIIKIPSLDYVSLILTRRKEIEKQIKEFKPDLIVGLQILTPFVGIGLAKKHKIPFVYYWTDVYHAQIPIKLYQPLGKYIEKRIIKKADAVIVINDLLKDYVLNLGSNPERTYVEKAGLDFNIFNPHITGENVRNEYKIKEDDILVLFVGWLYNFSGLKQTAMEICKNHSQHKNIKLLIVGEGDAYNDLKMMIDKYGMEDYVIMTGKVPYQCVPEFIAASDICILPSFNNEIMNDIVPIKLYEYMAMSKPVVASKLPGVFREFGQGNGIFYVDKPEDTFFKILDLIENYDLQKEGKNAYNFVKQNDWGNVLKHFKMIIENLTNTKRD
ncbi:MAG: glycosyltransferase [Methanobacterium sp.]